MSKEDFDIINEYKTLIEMIKFQRKEIKQERDNLQERINKAIEYLEHERFKRKILLGLYEKKYMKSIFNSLLEILKGDSNA